jgi:cytochrome P450 family 110
MSTIISYSKKAISLNLLQQLRYFNEPMTMGNWIRGHYGDFIPVHFQGHEYIGISTAEGARQIFARNPEDYDAFFKEGFTSIAGPASLWVLAGAAHRRERKLFAPAVHATHIREHGNTVLEITRHHLEKWQSGRTVKSIDTTMAISRDVIMRLVFGVEEGELMKKGQEILDELRVSLNPLITFIPALHRRWYPPWRRFTRAKERFSEWVEQVLTARRASGIEAGDVVSSMLATRYEDGSPMPDEEIRDELMTIMQGGHETTATVLAWALYELGRHPNILAKLRAELEASGPDLDPNVIAKLPYLSAVCDETVRLHPILAECARVPLVPMEILGHSMSPGQALVISIVSIHHDPEIYPEPDKFIPERFMEHTYDRYEFLPFGGAHRRCLGAALSEYETRIALAEIVLRWEFEPTVVERDTRHDVAMGPKYGVPLRILGRRKHVDNMRGLML